MKLVPTPFGFLEICGDMVKLYYSQQRPVFLYRLSADDMNSILRLAAEDSN
jgi:hypothetical protein